jgi:hypothetical protein
MSNGWANDALREEVPTVKNSVLLSLAAGEPRGWSLPAAALGTSLPACVAVPLTSARGAFTVARPKLHGVATAAAQQVTCEKYQDMARIAVNDGDNSGPHPAWDPV